VSLAPPPLHEFYAPSEDFVGMPDRERFTSEDEYFAALFHELTHSTGHESRLNRPTITEANGFGSDEYSREELIAEMGAAFLCGQAGIGERTIKNSAAYIQIRPVGTLPRLSLRRVSRISMSGMIGTRRISLFFVPVSGLPRTMISLRCQSTSAQVTKTASE